MINVGRQDLPVGAKATIDGVEMIHVGNGRFEPIGESLAKRFSDDDGEPVYMGNRP